MRRSTTRARRGEFLRIDDRTGFTVWSGDTVKEWTGAIVHRSQYEARHPQDFLRARRENLRVSDPRPDLSIENQRSLGPRQSFLALSSVAGDYGITIGSISNFSVGDWVRIFLDSGDGFLTTIASVPIRIDSENITIDSLTLLIDSTETLELSSPLPGPASAGNLIINISNVVQSSLS